MTRVAIVLGAGGPVASTFHLGVLRALADHDVTLTGAELVVATSAGAGIAAAVLAGLSLADAQRWATTPPTPEEIARFRSTMTTGGLRRFRPMSPLMARHLVRRGGLNLALTGILPTGRLPTTAMSRFLPVESLPVDSLPGELPVTVGLPMAVSSAWPEHLWIPATRLPAGDRVVFGRDSRPLLKDAVEATAAVPGFFVPKEIDGARYVDGAVFSANSADLAADSDADVVVVSSVQTRAGRSPLRITARARLAHELRFLTGKRVVLLEPGQGVTALLGGFPRGAPEKAGQIIDAAYQQALDALAGLL